MNTIYWTIIVILNFVFIGYLFIDMFLFSRKLRKGSLKFEKDMKEIVQSFIDTEKKRFDDAVKENQERIDKSLELSKERINLLSRENVRIREENDFLRDKLKNMGFTEEQLKY